jgi:hypothetical protein
VFESDKVDYRSAKKAAPLDIPPDLTQLQKDNRYAVPDGRGVATASGFQQQRGTPIRTRCLPSPAARVGLVSTDAVRIERAGNQRWLVVKQTPEQLWPQLEAFWPSVGFTVDTENAQTGIMETNWNENRAKIPQDIIRRTIGKVFDSAYSSGERDKFRTRLERRADGSTEIYISHRGAEEVLVGPQRETTTWVGRKSDPELEAEFLGRLMAQLNGATTAKDVKQATAAVANAAPEAQHATLDERQGHRRRRLRPRMAPCRPGARPRRLHRRRPRPRAGHLLRALRRSGQGRQGRLLQQAVRQRRQEQGSPALPRAGLGRAERHHHRRHRADQRRQAGNHGDRREDPEAAGG